MGITLSGGAVMYEPKHVELVHWIKQETKSLNINNVTRTMAYLEYYRRNPEIHWSLLAHMVSRNAGWNMTDLKGEFLPKLLSEEERNYYFMWLERGNWLIFQDAFPQLLLYEASKLDRNPLFHLLKDLSVSSFMRPIWKEFWANGNSSKLTMALIINEQNYIESRIVQNDFFKEKVLNKTAFALQDRLNLNYILFPTERKGNDSIMLGDIVHDFTQLEKRITIGKRLYSILFHYPTHLESIFSWATEKRHSGSRKDYWDHLFTDVRESIPGRLYNPHIHECELKQGVPKIYSPSLHFAWKEIVHEPPAVFDWFQQTNASPNLTPVFVEDGYLIKKKYCKSIEKLSLAVYMKKAIFERR